MKELLQFATPDGRPDFSRVDLGFDRSKSCALKRVRLVLAIDGRY